jgi:hypothetical protein
MDIASSLLSDSANAGLKPLSLEKINRAAPQTHRWTFTGAVGAATDQAPFYNLLTDVAEAGATLGTPAFASSASYSAATATRYIADCPAPLRTMHFTGAAGTGAATVLERTVVKFIRITPDGSEQREQIELSTFVSDQRFQTGVLSVPINGEVLDGYTYIRVLSPQGTPTANGYNLSFAWGATIDKRADVPAARPAVVASPR